MAHFTLRDVADMTGGTLIGDGSRRICGVCSPDEPKEDMLCVVWDESVLAGIPDAVPVLSGIGTVAGRDGVEMASPKSALPRLLPHFDPRTADTPGIHPSAQIAEGVIIGEACSIGPCCVLSSGVSLGRGVVLQANVYVGRNVTIGDDTRIEAFVSLQDSVTVGSRVLLHASAAVGCDGFGFVPGENGRWEKIPQIGTVVLEDDVEVGPNCTIDRATFGATRIRRGTKLGANVHIAHNCDVGEDCMVVGFVALGGSAKIGRNSLLAGMAGVSDHVTVGAGVTIAGRSGVTKDIPDGMTVSGFPAREHNEERRFQASLRRVRDYGERLKALERRTQDAGINKDTEDS